MPPMGHGSSALTRGSGSAVGLIRVRIDLDTGPGCFLTGPRRNIPTYLPTYLGVSPNTSASIYASESMSTSQGFFVPAPGVLMPGRPAARFSAYADADECTERPIEDNGEASTDDSISAVQELSDPYSDDFALQRENLMSRDLPGICEHGRDDTDSKSLLNEATGRQRDRKPERRVRPRSARNSANPDLRLRLGTVDRYGTKPPEKGERADNALRLSGKPEWFTNRSAMGCPERGAEKAKMEGGTDHSLAGVVGIHKGSRKDSERDA
ncbi:hypothetical protein B0H11DRAFT_2312916 [Mycena galericulata]|nr:hypothetical protein B0H11DRAFT_2312916 [Mycena galericulata]